MPNSVVFSGSLSSGTVHDAAAALSASATVAALAGVVHPAAAALSTTGALSAAATSLPVPAAVSQFWLAGFTATQNTTRWHAPTGGISSSHAVTTEARVRSVAATSGILKSLKVRLSATPAAGQTVRIQVSVAGVASVTLDVTIANGSTEGSAVADVAVTAGQIVTLKTTSSATTGSPEVFVVTEFLPTINNYFTYPASWAHATANPSTAPLYDPLLQGDTSVTTTESVAAATQDLVAFGGTIRSLYVDLLTAPGAGNSWDFIISINGVEQGTALNIADTSTTGNQTGLSIAVAAGDKLTFKIKAANSGPAATYFGWGVVLEPTTPGLSHIGAGMSSSLSASSLRYLTLTGTTAGADTTETDVQFKALTAFTASVMYVETVTAPGIGKTRVFRIRHGAPAANGNLVVTLTGASNTGNNSATDNVAVADLFNLIHTPSGSPANSVGTLWALAVTGATYTAAQAAEASLTTSGTLAGAALLTLGASAVLPAVASIAAISATVHDGAAVLSATATIAPYGTFPLNAAIVLNATAVLSAETNFPREGAAVLAATASLAALTALIDPQFGAASLTATATLSPTATPSAFVSLQAGITIKAAATLVTGIVSGSEPPVRRWLLPQVFVRSGWPPYGVLAELLTAHNIDPAELQGQPGAAQFNILSDDAAVGYVKAGNRVSIESPYFEPWVGTLITAEDDEGIQTIEVSCLGINAILDGRTSPQNRRVVWPVGAGLVVRNLVDVANTRADTGIDVSLTLAVGPSVADLPLGGQSVLESLEELHNRTGYEFWTQTRATRSRLVTTLYFDERQGEDFSDQMHLYQSVHFAGRHTQDASQVRQVVSVIGDYGPALNDRMSVTRTTLLHGGARDIQARALEVSAFLSVGTLAELPPGLYNEVTQFEVDTRTRSELGNRSDKSLTRPLSAQETFDDTIFLPALSLQQIRRLRIGNVYTRHGRFGGRYGVRKVRIKGMQPNVESGRCPVVLELVLS